MIGEIRFEHNGQTTSVQLNDDLTWHCEQDDLQQYLNEACPVPNYQPEFGKPGIHQLYQVGHRLNARCICFGDQEVELHATHS